MIQCDDLCKNCKFFDCGEYECDKGHYLDGDKYTVECEDCIYLMYSDIYPECKKAYKGIVNLWESCGKGKHK